MKTSNTETTPKIIAFFCHWSGYPVLGKNGTHSIRVMCSGRVSPGLILQAFELGAKGVLVLGCEEGCCHYSFGNRKAKENVKIASDLIHILGIDKNRLKLELVSAEEANTIVDDFVKQMKRMQ